MMRAAMVALGLVLAGAVPASAETKPWVQTEQDAYTRYELLDPGSAKFRIVYEVTDATPGATVYFNPIRKGSKASDERVTDRSTGLPLKFSVVSGAEAKSEGLSDAEADTDYIRVALAHPVPSDGGQARLLIEKTYEDPKSYFTDAKSGEIVFDRPLGIKRNAVVLPKGFELTSCNFPSQVLQEKDGRVAISFWNPSPAQAPLVLHAKAWPGAAAQPSSQEAKLQERAHQTRDIVYFLKAPETHAFALYHDYTETRPGVGRYVNVVRDGSHVSDPSGRDLDTGQALKLEVIRGEAIEKAGLEADDRPAKITPDSEVVVFSFAPVKPGASIRLRMSETYTDPESYKLVGDELVFFRTFGRAHDAVVLPDGWVLTNSTVPGTLSVLADGRTRLDFTNPRLDEIAVLITARRRGS